MSSGLARQIFWIIPAQKNVYHFYLSVHFFALYRIPGEINSLGVPQIQDNMVGKGCCTSVTVDLNFREHNYIKYSYDVFVCIKF